MPSVYHLLAAVVLVFYGLGTSTFAQTASPGPARNANVDNEDPNKPKTEGQTLPSQNPPGSGQPPQDKSAGENTPTGNDGSQATINRQVTQPVDGNLKSVQENNDKQRQDDTAREEDDADTEARGGDEQATKPRANEETNETQTRTPDEQKRGPD